MIASFFLSIFLNHPIFSPLAILQIYALLFNYILLHGYMYVYTHMHVWIYIYIHKYYLLNLHNAFCEYVFNDVHLALDKKPNGNDRISYSDHPLVICSSLNKAEAPWPSPIHFGKPFAIVLVRLRFRRSCCWDSNNNDHRISSCSYKPLLPSYAMFSEH